MASHQPAQEPGDRLRLIAAASVAALAVVLPLAAATADHNHTAQRRQAGHTASHRSPAAPDAGPGGAADSD
ncbi:MAG: hypothetical protein HOY69_42930 [Streptomyces sp.]|nr:hypothetical protein [Streptomyces sp.]